MADNNLLSLEDLDNPLTPEEEALQEARIKQEAEQKAKEEAQQKLDQEQKQKEEQERLQKEEEERKLKEEQDKKEGKGRCFSL